MKIIAQTVFVAAMVTMAAGSGLRAEQVEVEERQLQDFNISDLGEFICYACEACFNNFTSQICKDNIPVDEATFKEQFDANCGECEYLFTDKETGELTCFSEVATVQTRDGAVAMKDLKVGDEVMTGMNQYETVYAFAHHLPSKPAQFYQIHSENAKKPLEVTGEHMVFVGDSAVAANMVKVGDYLQSAMGPSKVTKISSVQRNGIYAPLTTGGSLIVDGVKASSYVTLGEKGLISDHNMIHTVLAPFRVFCSGVSSRVCENDFNTANGMPFYVQYGLDFLRWVGQSGLLVQSVAWPMIYGVTGSFLAAEMLFGASLAPMMILIGAVAYASRDKKSKTKTL